MYLFSISQNDKKFENFSTVPCLGDFFRSFCQDLNTQKFMSLSNFKLFLCQIDDLEDTFLLTEDFKIDCCNCTVENLSDAIYSYLKDNISQYFELVKSIDEYRLQISNYKLDK